ncbi:MAG: hypothetical protein JO142_14770 [Burkholderiales bacterium]|nr:hypothetical protein [Burkholderiales bacterium]
MMKTTFYFLLLLPIAIAGCGGGGTQDPAAGPCDLRYTEPVVLVTSATDAVTNHDLGAITISGVQIYGVAANLVVVAQTSSSVSISDTNLRCTTPCGFGWTEGKYSFTAAAPGYQPATVTVDARYSSRSGDCPLVMSGGTKVAIVLKSI